jgi:hypothetical protein
MFMDLSGAVGHGERWPSGSDIGLTPASVNQFGTS